MDYNPNTMPTIERLSLLHKVAEMYFEEGLKKFEIARRIDQSPTQVGLLLRTARKEGIVKISINLPKLLALQESLKRKLELADAIVVPFDNDLHLIRRRLSSATAQYFEGLVHDGDSIAIGGGQLTFDAVNFLQERDRDIRIYPMTLVGRGPSITHVDPQIVATALWVRCGNPHGKLNYLTVTPPAASSTADEVRDYYRDLRRLKEVKSFIRDLLKVKHIFSSVGGIDVQDTYLQARKKSAYSILEELKIGKKELKGQGVVGDIGYSLYDCNGIGRDEWNIFPGIEVEHLAKMASSRVRKIVLTAGNYKLEALRAAIAGRLCNVLITDSKSAAALLSDATDFDRQP